MSTAFQQQPPPPPLAGGRGIKGFFSRTRSFTPEPSIEHTVRSRLRSILNDTHIPGSRRSSRPSTSSNLRDAPPPVPSKSRASRPSSPGTRRTQRVAVSALPIIQRGTDGKWQAPSLSKGSMSTSALAELALDGEDSAVDIRDRRTKLTMSVFADTKAFPVFDASSSTKPTPVQHNSCSPSRPISPLTLENPSRREPHRKARQSSTDSMPSRPNYPTASSPPGSSIMETNLSQDHFLIRLSISFLIRTLPGILRGPGFVRNSKTTEMKVAADEKLALLSRMEKVWGTEWSQIAKLLQYGNMDASGDRPAHRSFDKLEAKLRNVSVTNRTKEREAKQFAEALSDGILLCLLLNHLFPSQPPRISRVNMSEDAVVRATNLTRFTLACHSVGLREADVFRISDLQEGSETSLSKVAKTIVALARLAGRPSAGLASSRPSSPTSPMGPPTVPYRSAKSTSASPSRRGSASTSPTLAEPTPRSSLDDRPPRSPSSGMSGAVQVPNDMQSRLQTMHSAKSVDSEMEPSPKTPIAAVFDEVPPLNKRSYPSPPRGKPGIPRSQTQPIQSTTQSILTSPSRADSRNPTPPRRPSVVGPRPALRPRMSSGSRAQASLGHGLPSITSNVQLSDTPDSPSEPRNGFHLQERTPSLVSSRSAVTSGYTVSSGIRSMDSFPSGEYTLSAAIVEADVNYTRDSGPINPHVLRADAWQSASQDELFTTQVDPRGHALSRSLAALEGQAMSSPNIKFADDPVTPRKPRPGSRLGRIDVSRVMEEEDESKTPLMIHGPKPLLRRVSTNGKTYVPKRSLSPREDGLTPHLARSDTAPVAYPRPNHASQSILMSRRQSETAVPKVEDSPTSPTNMKVSSMVNLAGSSSSFLERRQCASSAQRVSQVLEIAHHGRSSVKYQLGNCIGRGQFGSVYRSLNLTTGQMAAIKRINLSGLQESEVEGVMHEVELLKRLDHPCIVKYEGMLRDEEYLNIILEYVENGSLGQTLKAFGNFNEELVSSYVAKILEGLAYLHSQGVVHCDLKAANILSTKNGNVKLSDFGVSLVTRAVANIKHEAFSMRHKEKDISSGKQGTDVAGTPNWMAPEVISLNGASPPSDIWSLGCTIIELLTGRPPYSDIPNSMTVLFRIVEDDFPPLPSDISDNLRDFLQLCFIKDPSARPSATQLFLHPWVMRPDLVDSRPMDSVPFLRRLSMDSRRPDSSVIFPRYGEGTRPNSMALTASRPASIAVASEMSEEDLRAVFRQNLHSPNLQFASRVPTPESTPRKNHKLIKTTFSNAILCRVCHANVKKSGLLCQTCGMICHTTCATKAGMTCDVKLQLVLLARQEEMLSMAGLETTTSFHSPQSTQTRGQRGASSPAPMSPAEDADHDNETIGAGKLFAGLRARRESAKGPSRIRRLSRRSSKAVPDDLTAAECFSAEPSEHRRDNATRFQTEMRHLHHHEGVASSAATKSQNNLQIDVLPASSRELEPSGKSDCSIM